MLRSKIHAQNTNRIFVDASYTLGSGRNSGIERVVRNLSAQTEQLSAEGQRFEYSQVISSDGKFVSLTAAQCQSLARFGSLRHDVLREQSLAYRAFASSACSVVRSKALQKWLLPEPGHLGIFKLPYSFKASRLQRKIATSGQSVQPGPGDLFLLPDAYWVSKLQDTVWPAAQDARAAGATVACVIYDLIPLTHPQFVGKERSTAFKKYLVECARSTDLLLTISKTVRDDLVEFLRGQNDPTLCSAVEPFELGCELSNCDGEVRSHVQEVFTGDAPYLTVSSFDPRKNHEYLLDAMEKHWTQGSGAKLVLVGRLGAKADATVQRIRAHEEFGRKLFLFNDLDDAELQYCYRNAGGVIFPSIVEGFGLPIVESLWFGQKTFASDTKIHREVGQQDCTYFALDGPQSLVEQLVQWEDAKSSGAPTRIAQRRLTSWKQSAEQVLNICGSLSATKAADRSAA